MEADTWVGIGLGSTGMATGTDMIQVDGANQVVYDKVSSGYQFPSTDDTDNLTSTFTENGNLLTVVITRDLDTEDSDDYVIPSNTSWYMGWAIKTTSATLNQIHD